MVMVQSPSTTAGEKEVGPANDDTSCITVNFLKVFKFPPQSHHPSTATTLVRHRGQVSFPDSYSIMQSSWKQWSQSSRLDQHTVSPASNVHRQMLHSGFPSRRLSDRPRPAARLRTLDRIDDPSDDLAVVPGASPSPSFEWPLPSSIWPPLLSRSESSLAADITAARCLASPPSGIWNEKRLPFTSSSRLCADGAGADGRTTRPPLCACRNWLRAGLALDWRVPEIQAMHAIKKHRAKTRKRSLSSGDPPWKTKSSSGKYVSPGPKVVGPQKYDWVVKGWQKQMTTVSCVPITPVEKFVVSREMMPLPWESSSSNSNNSS